MELSQKNIVSNLNEYENGLSPNESNQKLYWQDKNCILKDKSNLIRVESELNPCKIDINYQPQISSSHLKDMANGQLMNKLADHVSRRNKKNLFALGT